MGVSTSKRNNISHNDSTNTLLPSEEIRRRTRGNSFFEDQPVKKYKIELIIEVNGNDTNKDIFFLNNINNISEEEKQNQNIHNLLEINEFNTDLYINNKKCEFKKYLTHINEEIKEYHIELVFKYDFLIKNCSYMFYNCKNIAFIDLSKFNTLNTVNMSNMFYGCNNLKSIKLSTLFNTTKVT